MRSLIGILSRNGSLSGNKGLCGLPSLPKCSLLWGKNGLSTGGKLAIALSCLIVVSSLVLLYYFCIRRRHSDYDFAPPHELACKFSPKQEASNFIFIKLRRLSALLDVAVYELLLFRQRSLQKETDIRDRNH